MADHLHNLQDVAAIAEHVECRLVELSKRPSDERVALAMEALRVAMRTVLALAQQMGSAVARHEE